MKRTSLFWQLYPSYLLIMTLCLAGTGWYLSSVFQQFYFDQVEEDLIARAQLIRVHVRSLPELSDEKKIDALCKNLGALVSTRITVILPSGKVIGDSEKDPALMDNHATRPEIKVACKGLTGSSIRYSHTLKTRMMYVAIPLKKENRIIAVIRASKPLSAIEEALASIRLKIIWGCFCVILFSAPLSFVVSRRLSRPVKDLTKGAECFTGGNLEHRISLPPHASYEFHLLADTMNRMARELDMRISDLAQQRNELDTVLSSMYEGVVALDLEKRIVFINDSAAQLFKVDKLAAPGRPFEELTRHPHIQNLVQDVTICKETVYEEIEFPGNDEIYLLVHGTPLKSFREDIVVGVLLVFNDITKLKQIEKVRRDFVANVSHELKTPITAIRGAVETLIDLLATADNRDCKRFMEIILENTRRINRIVEDLLILARLEQSSDRYTVEFEKLNVSNLLEMAKEACSIAAGNKQVEIIVSCNEDIFVRGNPHFLEQAIINLIDNAIKYSGAGRKVLVQAEEEKDMVVIRVIDHGCGIPAEHLPRVFERFYRVDKSRSREMGGTGLGLAIVKHAVCLHGGKVSVESTPGKGSIFSISIPN
ncbi:MAG TPA: HAMP domain-containing histidine kinase [Deltaproteobacteria bacterium]|nr:HAMP domain-containing histidine kinase [Deltaproteobacteria bacterium]